MSNFIDICIKLITLMCLVAAIVLSTIKTKSRKQVTRDKFQKLVSSGKYRFIYVDRNTGQEYELTKDNVKIKSIDE